MNAAPKPRKRPKKKRHPLVRASVLKRSPPKSRGKPKRFAKRRCPELLQWIRGLDCAVHLRVHQEGLEHCAPRPDRPVRSEPAHLKTRGAGGDDRDSVVPLCPKHHDEQEGKTAAFEAKYRVNLKEFAVGYTKQFDAQVALGWEAE